MIINYKGNKPTRKHENDAGSDLTASSLTYDSRTRKVIYKTNTNVSIPEGFVGILAARSSIRNYDLLMSNSVRIIDVGFTGEIEVTFDFTGLLLPDSKIYKKGDRIAQLIIIPYIKVTYEEVDELIGGERGNNGHGSTGE